MNKEIHLTKEKLENLKEELRKFKEEKRPAVIAKIKEARSLGDLSENAEYQSAREEQSFIEGKIQELEYMIKNAKIIEDGKNKGTVSLGSKVFCDVEGEKQEFTIVGSAEVDVEKGKISNESPIGKALLGRKKGDIVEIEVPNGKMRYKIINVK